MSSELKTLEGISKLVKVKADVITLLRNKVFYFYILYIFLLFVCYRKKDITL